jgi:rhamnogalacturonan endolyase
VNPIPIKRIYLSTLFFVMVFAGMAISARYMENLGRGVVAVRTDSSHVYVGWRMLGTEWGKNIGFHIYRDGVRITTSPITSSTNYTDTTTVNDTYSVSAVIDGIERAASEPVNVWSTNYLSVPLQVPAGVTTPDNVTCSYSPNDCSVGDLDGDGEYEIVLKWDPSNSKDNASSGYTGNVYLDAYEMDGTQIWRIDLGRNIRAGAHYTQFMVYDLDSDGKAEVACKTADATIDGTGIVIGDINAEHILPSGFEVFAQIVFVLQYPVQAAI